MRIGHGYDVHRFGEGDFITLGGVRIPHKHGLVAHSDGDVMDVSSSKRTETVNMAFLEVMNPDVLKVVYGDDVAVDEATGAISFPHGKEPADRSYVCDSILKGNRIDRLVLPQGRISEMDTVAFKKGELKTLPVTIKAISDEEGNPSYEYISGTTAAA